MNTMKTMLWAVRSGLLCSLLGAFLVVPAMAEEFSLKDSVVSTLQHSPQLKTVQENYRAVKHDLEQAEGGWFPRLSASAGYGTERYSDPTSRRRTADDANDWKERGDTTLTLSQLVFDGSLTSSNISVQEARVESIDSRLVDNAEALALDAVRAHLEVYRQSLIVDLSTENVERHQEILASQEEREASGAGSLADVTQTKGRLARALSSLASSEGALRTAIANYKRVVGTEPDEIAEGSMPAMVAETFDSALDRVLAANPKLKAQSADIEAAEFRVDVAEAAYYPTVRVEASSRHQDKVGSARYSTDAQDVQVRMNWNIFNGGSDLAASRAAKARTRQERMALQNLKEGLIEQAKATWSDLRTATTEAELYAEAIEYNRQTRDMYMQQFTVGQRSLLDVLDAENELFSSSIQLVTAEVNRQIAAYKLLALGGELVDSFSVQKDMYTPEVE